MPRLPRVRNRMSVWRSVRAFARGDARDADGAASAAARSTAAAWRVCPADVNAPGDGSRTSPAGHRDRLPLRTVAAGPIRIWAEDVGVDEVAVAEQGVRDEHRSRRGARIFRAARGV